MPSVVLDRTEVQVALAQLAILHEDALYSRVMDAWLKRARRRPVVTVAVSGREREVLASFLPELAVPS